MVQISQNHSTEAVRLIAKKFLDSADEVFCDDNIKAMQPAVKNRSPLAICLEELSDLTAPIKGHGLISLTRLVLSKDKETLQRLDEIIPLLTGI